MGTTKAGIYRQYRGPVPRDAEGRPLPASQWPRLRPSSWLVRWFGLEGKRYARSFDTRKEAERFAETKQAEVRQGRADPPMKIMLKTFAKEHKKLMAGNVRPTTLAMQVAVLDLLAVQVGWDRQIQTIRVRDIEAFRAERLKTKISAVTANKEVKLLKGIFNRAIRRDYLPAGTNPCVGLPMIKTTIKRPPYLGPEGFQKVLQKAQGVLWQALLATVYTTGIRLREATNLTWLDVDFEAGQLHVSRKDAHEFVQPWQPKDYELRTIPLPRQAVDLLATLQAEAPEGCPYVYMERPRWEYYRKTVQAGRWQPGRDLSNNLLRRFQTLCRQAGVGTYTLHDLRRSCITNWALHLPIHVVQQLAGHSDIKTTQQFYLSIRQEDVSKAQKVQEEILGQIPTVQPPGPDHKSRRRPPVFPGRQGCRPRSSPLD